MAAMTACVMALMRCRAFPRARTCSRGNADRKSTRLNSSHDQISYAVFCLKKKNTALAVTQAVTERGLAIGFGDTGSVRIGGTTHNDGRRTPRGPDSTPGDHTPLPPHDERH